ncbi:MAG: 3-oxoacyl-ACP reductase [Candidatus Roseilinea sp.]|jgi:NAD(P)-dependent dehydrogenase (short-subunit alcohol dehydrogenase family)|nr:MAG: 3-oxoacyl-ACP reductase [Candidatus Roseilinea sp.]
MNDVSSLPVAVITGAAGGIGKGCAIQLAADGYAVVIADLRGEAAQATAEAFAAQGRRALAVPVDITDPDACAAMIARAVEAFGRVDVLVNSAGISKPEPSLDVSPESWRRMIEVQLNGVFFASQAAGRQMVKQGWGGCIVNISSINAEAAFPMRTAYSCAKAGVNMMTKTLAIEWAQYGIRVNAVGPCHTETEMTAENIRRGAVSVDVLKKRIPLGRLAKVEDVANAVSFLCSPKAAFITGHALYVDGGYLAFGYW